MHSKILIDKTILVLGSWLLVLVSFSGCATSYGRQNDQVAVFFKTNTPQATVLCEGQATEVPGNIRLKQSVNHDCLAKAPGYQDLNFRVWSRVSSEGFRYSTRANWKQWSKWTLGIGNLFAWPVDFLSGSMRTLENDHYELKMHPSAQVSAASKFWDKTVDMTRKIASAPSEAVEGATGTVLSATVKAPAEALGLASDDKRKEMEQVLQGQSIVDRMQTTK